MMGIITTYFTVLWALLLVTVLSAIVIAIGYKIASFTQDRFGYEWSMAVFIIYVILAVSALLTLGIILEGASV